MSVKMTQTQVVIPNPVEVWRNDDTDGITVTSDLASHASSRGKKSGESLLISDWVRRGLFRYCKFVTCSDELEYGEPLSLFALEENNILENKQKWWNMNKKLIVQTLKEKRGCVSESIKLVFKSK